MPNTKDFKPEISEIEQFLVDLLARHSAVKWHQQVEFRTTFCEFFLDMGCLVRPGRAIGLECDGKEYHLDPVREFCRDALILGTGRLACIYHIEAWAIRKRQIDWLRILSELEPEVFTPESRIAIHGLAAGFDKVTMLRIDDRYTGFMFRSTAQSKNVKSFLEFAKSNSGVSFPVLVERAREKGEFER
jgi:hypothetical protein